jgi:hypothetical protein
MENDKMKSEVEKQSKSERNKAQEVRKLQEDLKMLKKTTESSGFKDQENSDVLQRLQSLTCQSFKSAGSNNWEDKLNNAIFSNLYTNINFMQASEGNRILFMPHSPGVYMALVLKNADEIESEQVGSNPFSEIDMNKAK